MLTRVRTLDACTYNTDANIGTFRKKFTKNTSRWLVYVDTWYNLNCSYWKNILVADRPFMVLNFKLTSNSSLLAQQKYSYFLFSTF